MTHSHWGYCSKTLPSYSYEKWQWRHIPAHDLASRVKGNWQGEGDSNRQTTGFGGLVRPASCRAVPWVTYVVWHWLWHTVVAAAEIGSGSARPAGMCTGRHGHWLQKPSTCAMRFSCVWRLGRAKTPQVQCRIDHAGRRRPQRKIKVGKDRKTFRRPTSSRSRPSAASCLWMT